MFSAAKWSRFILAGLLLAGLFATSLAIASSGDEIAALKESFRNPPPNSRIMMRWWWFGPSVEKTELERELREMQRSGIGGVEIQPVYPLELDHASDGFHNYPYLSDEFLEALRFANGKARELGLRVDLTLGSGWPYGGPHISPALAAGMLRCETVSVPDDQDSVAVPYMAESEKLLAAFLVPRTGPLPANAQQLTDIARDRLHLPSGRSGGQNVLFFIAGRTGMQVKRPTIGAEGFVLDHFSRAAIDKHLHVVGDTLMKAFDDAPPFSVFSDSLEVYGADWTPDLLEQFRQRRGYDLTPYLPALTTDFGAVTSQVRYDWGRTLNELINERYLAPVRQWASEHKTTFRSQVYGTPAVSLSSNAFVDWPEGEGFQWKGFTPTRWASSANHLFNKNVTSSETFTWLHSPTFRATPLDVKAEADEFFLEGSNQIVGHGWPYSPPSAGEPGWRFYAAGALNDHNPWWPVMPEVARYLQRVSWILRQGQPANDVAVLLPTEDALSQFRTGGHVSISEAMPALLGPTLIPQIEDAGFNFDFIDSGAIQKVGIHHAILVLQNIQRLPLPVYQVIEQYAKKGGVVIAVGRLPKEAPGLIESPRDSREIETISERLFHGANAIGHFVANDSDLSSTLVRLKQPDLTLSPRAPAVGFVHRHLQSADVYFLANTENRPVRVVAKFRVSGAVVEWWDPFNGEVHPAEFADGITLGLEPYESRIIVFPHETSALRSIAHASKDKTRVDARNAEVLDISRDWNVTFEGTRKTTEMHLLHSWTDDPETKYYSGRAVYAKDLNIPAQSLRPGVHVMLDFGKGQPVDLPETGHPRNRAWFESPVREMAQVTVNGVQAGFVWHPPYEIDITSLVRPGANTLSITVGNLAINSLAGVSQPDYRLLNLLYGKRFEPQDMQNMEPLPSGLQAPLRLVFH